MGEQQEKLTVIIGQQGAETVEQRMSALEQAFIRSNAAVKAHGDALDKHGDALGRSSKGIDGASDGLAKFEKSNYVAARALNAMGLEAEAGAVKVSALIQVLEGIGDAIPELLALGAAIAVATATFEFLKSSVDDAAKSQRELVTIGALLRDQSVADWQAQSRAVDAYATTIAKTSIFQKTDALAGMQAMLTAGMKINDVIRSQAPAMELATAKTITLKEADQELADAYDGHFRGLVKLGIITREEMKSGIDYETILKRIEDRMSGTAAAALDTYSGKMQNLGNLTGLLKEQFGDALLPVLSAFEDAMRAGVTAMQPLTDEFKDWVQSNLPELKAGAQGFGQALIGIAQEALPLVEQGVQDTMKALADLGVSFKNGNDPIKGFADAIKGAREQLDAFHQLIEQFDATGKPLSDALNAINKAATDSGKAVHDHVQEIKDGQAPADEFTQELDGIADAFTGIFTTAGNAMRAVEGFIAATRQKIGDLFGGNEPDPSSIVFGDEATAIGIMPRSGHTPSGSPASKATGSGVPPTHVSSHFIPGTSVPRAAHAAKAPGQTTSSFTPAEYQTDKVDQYTAAQTKLDEALKKVDASEKGLAEAIKLAGTVEEQRTAQARYDAQVKADLVAKHKLLNDAIWSENQALDKNGVAYVNARVAADEATDAYNKLGNSLNDGHKKTIDETNALAAAKSKMDEANKAAAALLKSIDELTKGVRTNTDALAANDIKLDAIASKAAEAAAAASRAWETFQKKNAEALSEDLATFNLTNAQKVTYYAAVIAQMGAITAENEKEAERLYGLETSAYKAALHDRETAQKKFIDTVTKYETNWLDEILIKHDGLKNSLANIFNEILLDFTKMIEQMILKSTLFKSINANIFSAFGGSAGANGGGGVLSLLGGGGSTGGGAFSGSPTGVDISSVGGVPLGLNTPIPTNLSQVNGESVGAAGKAGGVSTSSGGGLASGGLAGAGQGAMIGALLSQFTGGNETNAGIGGALGGAFGGPLGGAIGGLLGGLFGNKGLGPGKQPDIFDQSWGQTDTNWNGDNNQTFNGQQVSAVAADNAYLGGTPLYKQMEQWAAANAGSASTLTQAQQALLKQIQQLEAGNPNANLGVVNQANGMATLANGQQISVTALENLSNLFGNAASGNTIAPVFQVTHAYPNLNQTSMTQTGVYDETKGVYSPSAGGGTTAPGQRSPLGGNIVVNLQGSTLVGVGGIDQVTQLISKSLQRGFNGAAPGSTQSFLFANGRAGDGG